MCGIAGIVDLSGRRRVPSGIIQAMAQTLYHRGPDEDGYLERPGLALASRRLSIVGLADGRQPISNEDGSVSVVYNGEFFDYPEQKAKLEGRGHRFATHADTELLPHFWEDHDEGFFDQLRGQFAFALWDERKRRLILGRDRFGICPLYWTRQTTADGDWLLFASEIRALLASGLVVPRVERRGINHVFTFFAVPGPVTCFAGVQLLQPGHYLRVQLGREGSPVENITDRVYWEMDFPDKGDEDPCNDEKQLVDRFEDLLLKATKKRLRADVPVVSYLSGGVDSSTVVALASHVRGRPIPTFTIRIEDPNLDETSEAAITARHVGTEPIVVGCGDQDVLDTYPELIGATEAPVVDTSCTALLLLAKEVHRRGYKVALTGEGADEWLAGYPWNKISKLLGYLDVVPGLRLSQTVRKMFVRLSGVPRFNWEYVKKVQQAVGGHNAWLDIYSMMTVSKLYFFSPEMKQLALDNIPYADVNPNLERMRRWHPFNRATFYAGRIHLPGLLLSLKGDRVAMHSSVETRYPFLDEDVFNFLARIHPKWKMRGLREKYLLRRLGERWLPQRVAWRSKAMFRAPFDSFFARRVPAFIEQLLSDESLRKTGYFNIEAVQHWRRAFAELRPNTFRRTALEMGLVGVVATQLWHHLFIDDSLAELPVERPTAARGLAGMSRNGTAKPHAAAGVTR
jgi:asparagine synthase (glutamine-hydrolysing)